MRRREFIMLLGGAAIASPVLWPLPLHAQQKPWTIGFMGAGAADTSAPLLEAVRQGLRENGLVEGKDVVLEPRWAEGHYERFAAHARELTEQGARAIIVTTIAACRAAQRATSVIPIIMANLNDPAGSGLVASLSRPGGNTTGLATLAQDVTPKLLEFLHIVLPNAKTVAALFNPANPSNLVFLDKVRVQASPLGIKVQDFALKAPGELDAAFDAIASQRADAVLVIPDAATLDFGTRIAALQLQHRLPVVSTDSDLTSAGGLISYGTSRRENYRRSAYFVKKVLDGVKPADLPVEQPTRILLSLNLATAKVLGLAIPPTMIVRADEVIE
jgi:putative tryptophan/tyrosine transport system substrate-binding protein